MATTLSGTGDQIEDDREQEQERENSLGFTARSFARLARSLSGFACWNG